MATYFVASGGSNTAPHDTWAKAATSFQTALTAATATGDIVVVQYNAVPAGDAELAIDTTYTIGGNVAIFAGTNDGGSAWTQTTMGTANWIGNSTANRSIILAGAFQNYIYGLTFRLSGTAADQIRLCSASGSSRYFENCYFWLGNTNSASVLQTGGSTGSHAYAHLRGCTVYFGHVDHYISITAARTVLEELTIAAAGSSPTRLLQFSNPAGSKTELAGCDLSHMASGCELALNAPDTAADVIFTRCKLPASHVALATQADLTAGARVWLYDCASGDVHGNFEYHDSQGSMVLERATYLTAGAAGLSWKITTTANASKVWPFRSPWVDAYHAGTSAITPYVEVLRNNGVASAYTDQDVWAQFSVKDTSGSVLASLLSDRASNYTAAGTAQAAGVGTGSWTIAASSSPYSMKLDSGAAVTPAEVGEMRMRVVCAVPSITLFVDPFIRT